MKYIKDIQNTYGKIFRGIALWLQHLQSNESDEIQQF